MFEITQFSTYSTILQLPFRTLVGVDFVMHLCNLFLGRAVSHTHFKSFMASLQF